MLIGLNGRLKAGKDTTFRVIQNHCPYAERVSFADPLKESAAQALGMSNELVESLKAHEEIHIQIPTMTVMQSNLSSELKAEASNWELNMRSYLQRYGTEAHREIFGDDFWVDMALPLDLDHNERLLVVTDARFPNEAERIKELGGVMVKVVRDVRTAHSHHPSEQNIDHLIDYELDNTGTEADLDGKVVRMLLHFGVSTTIGEEYHLGRYSVNSS